MGENLCITIINTKEIIYTTARIKGWKLNSFFLSHIPKESIAKNYTIVYPPHYHLSNL